jgi:hypothetical protein
MFITTTTITTVIILKIMPVFRAEMKWEILSERGNTRI